MFLRVQTKACLHLLTLAWVITWITTIPLFHTHLPDVNDGLATHQGLAHTVFSPDLPGEFSCTHSNVLHLSTKSQHSPELGFVLSTEDSPKTHGEPIALNVVSSALSKSLLARSSIESRAHHRKFNLFGNHQASRAPPYIVSS
jgi:hypothetical protein